MRILITGGAGFVGGFLGRAFLRASEQNSVVLFDNLRRRGSEWNVAALMSEGATFVHGDVRNPTDLEAVDGQFDILIEASAEASVHAGVAGSPRYVLDTNLTGALNCLELARKRCGALVFLSTSRVYSIDPLRALPLKATATRLDLGEQTSGIPGVTFDGVAEAFALDAPRSYYGASKLAAELLCQEYSAYGGLRVVINRCGVIAGPGQFGKTDQGVFTLWVARHHFGRPLTYTGFGGRGLQVRDLLHVEDLADLIRAQIDSLDRVSGRIFNVGGGRKGSVSLMEFTEICRDVTGREVTIKEDDITSPVDVPWYITDHANASQAFHWSPRRDPRQIATDTLAWIRENEAVLANVIV
jgi:CDP-paratose 2-epimerase